MRNEAIFADGIAPPTSFYSHATLVRAGAEHLYVSGQIPVRADGSVPEDAAEQAKLCWENLGRVLAAAGMSFEHLVKTQAFVTDARYCPAYREARNAALGDLRPASTLLVVAALGQAAWKVEVEAVAARQ
jgi:2-iminobutanoate/2-iminopropanoate deaminase